MHVVIGMMGDVEIEHVAHDRNVEAAGGDIGGHQQRDFTLAELVERRGAGRLVHVAMQGADAEAVLLQRFVNDGDFTLAIAEDDRVLKILGVAQQTAKNVALVVRFATAGDLELRHADSGGGRLRYFDPLGIVQEGFGDAADFRRHRRGEEKCLPRERHQLADPFDVGDEAHVQHAVGFVDDEQFDAGEEEAAALGMVEQPAGGCDQHVDAARQLGVLVAERDAADQERDVEFLADAVFVEILFDLGCKFAGRFEDQGARHSCPGAALFQHGEHGQDEGGGLAGAGLGDAENVAAGQNVRDRLFLNGSRGGVAGGRHSGEDLIGKAEMGKRH